MAAKPEKLSFDDAQILRLESATIKGHTGKLIVLGGTGAGEQLGAGRVRDRVAERIGTFPRLTQRVALPRLRLGRAAWVDAPDADLDWHVAGNRSAEPVDDAGLRGLVGELVAARLEHARPLWRIDVIPMTEGRTALVGRIHHAMADGVSAIRLAAGLLFDEAAAGEPAPPPGAPTGAPGAAKPSAAATKPTSDEERIIVGLPAALWRELRPGADSALDRHIGGEREVAWTSFQLDELKAIEHAAGEGVTVNDVVLALVAGGLRRWLEGSDRLPTLRVQVPVSLHAREEAANEVGNRDSYLNVDLPIGESDPVARLLAINSETRQRKMDHDADALYAFFHALGRFRPLYRGVTRLTSGPREFALSVSNVPGPKQRPSILGQRVEQFCSFAEPADRHALRISVLSLGGELAFGLCADPEAIANLGDLPDALAASMAELQRAV